MEAGERKAAGATDWRDGARRRRVLGGGAAARAVSRIVRRCQSCSHFANELVADSRQPWQAGTFRSMHQVLGKHQCQGTMNDRAAKNGPLHVRDRPDVADLWDRIDPSVRC